jgi:DNA-binding transcriptional LysR family regulator
MSLERSVELRQLRYAVAVADHLNFREASRALHVAQPPLSVQIKQLEEEIGVASLHSFEAPCGDHPSG